MTMFSAGISVVIPCHNDGPYLDEALRSVFAQSLPADEVIVIDDGSTDESYEVAAAFGPKLHYQAQPHQGIAAARNAGLAAARGQYVAFLDADDVWPEDSLQLRFNACEPQPGRAAALGMTEEFLSPEVAQTNIAARLARGPVQVRLAGAMLIRRTAFSQIGGFDEALAVGEWIDWMDRFAHAGLQTVAVPEPVLRRRVHAGNLNAGIPAQWGDYLTALRTAMKRRTAPNEASR